LVAAVRLERFDLYLVVAERAYPLQLLAVVVDEVVFKGVSIQGLAATLRALLHLVPKAVVLDVANVILVFVDVRD